MAPDAGAARELSSDLDAETSACERLIVDAIATERIDLPGIPEIVQRVQRVLQNPDVGVNEVVRILGAEPAIAARVLQMANSAALSAGGRTVTDLRMAVTRIGFVYVRSATLAFSMAQLRRAPELAPVAGTLRAHWECSTLVAAYSVVVSREFTKLSPDVALLAGLMHRIGEMFIVSQAARFPLLLAAPAVYFPLEQQWRDGACRALFDAWNLPDGIHHAVLHYLDTDRAHTGPADLTDVLAVAHVLANAHGYPDAFERQLNGLPAAHRLQLDRARIDQLAAGSKEEILQLKALLGF